MRQTEKAICRRAGHPGQAGRLEGMEVLKPARADYHAGLGDAHAACETSSDGYLQVSIDH